MGERREENEIHLHIVIQYYCIMLSLSKHVALNLIPLSKNQSKVIMTQPILSIVIYSIEMEIMMKKKKTILSE